MSPADRDLGYIWDMNQAACEAQGFFAGQTFEDYQQNKMLRLATERLLEIMGQAGKEVSSTFKEKYSDIPWAKIIGLRNVLAHEYGEVKDEKVYLVVTKDIPSLVSRLQAILKENNESF